ncbi:MAG: 6,7-dimethyl-8-ribityllumazine synthase [Chromatiales bacterium]|nr:6,7-dimethyl-8-ribityllumazine synthase [Chromatiales bacterium]
MATMSRRHLRTSNPTSPAPGLRIGIVMSRFNQDIVRGPARRPATRGAASASASTTSDIADRQRSRRAGDPAGAAAAWRSRGQLRRAGRARRRGARRDLPLRGRLQRVRRAASCDVQLETGVPIANGVLTAENDEQALRAHRGRRAPRRAQARSRWPTC